LRDTERCVTWSCRSPIGGEKGWVRDKKNLVCEMSNPESKTLENFQGTNSNCLVFVTVERSSNLRQKNA